MGGKLRSRTLSPQRLLTSSITFGRCLEVASQLGRFFCGMLYLEEVRQSEQADIEMHIKRKKSGTAVPLFNLILCLHIKNDEETGISSLQKYI